MIQFSVEAVVLCASALGVALWIAFLLDADNVISAVFYWWMATICVVTSVVYLVRWVSLP